MSSVQHGKIIKLFAILCWFCASFSAQAMPNGGTVVGGSAEINHASTLTTINQSTLRSVIEWLGFSVAANETVQFNLPSGGAVLNRVIGKNISQIDGQIKSNGSVYLVNPNGLVFSTTSKVTAQNFIASTLDMTNDDFMAGHGKLSQNSALGKADHANTARITLKGEIEVASKGVAAFFAPHVENQGIIKANLGTVVMGGSEKIVMDFTGDGLFNFELGAIEPDLTGNTGNSAPLPEYSVKNSGVIEAEGGAVYLTAQGAKNLVNALVENDGVIKANSLDAKGGVVELMASGGRVIMNGVIDVSGGTGGGAVYLGGDFQGAATDITGKFGLKNAALVTIGKSGKINADATQNGTGGKIVVWSDGATFFNGNIAAEGGNLGGDGGAIEISGKKYLNFLGDVSTKARKGKPGSLLLDPSDITIANVAQSDIVFCSDGDCANSFFSDAPISTLSVYTLNRLLAKNRVIINANSNDVPNNSTGKITIDADIYWNSGTDLIIFAGTGGIELTKNGSIVGNGTLNLSTKNADVILRNNIYLNGGKKTILELEMGTGRVIFMNENSNIYAANILGVYPNLTNEEHPNLEVKFLRYNNGTYNAANISSDPIERPLMAIRQQPAANLAPPVTHNNLDPGVKIFTFTQPIRVDYVNNIPFVNWANSDFFLTSEDNIIENSKKANNNGVFNSRSSDPTNIVTEAGLGQSQNNAQSNDAMRRFNDDLAMNYLYPMQGNSDLWSPTYY